MTEQAVPETTTGVPEPPQVPDPDATEPSEVEAE